MSAGPEPPLRCDLRLNDAGIRSVVGPIAGSETLEAVPAQPVEPVRVRLASQELSGDFPIRSRGWLLSSGR